MKKWTITKLIAIGSLAVVRLLLSLIGAPIVTVTGIPGSSGAVTIFIMGITLAFTCLSIRKFGAATIMSLIHGILELPLPLSGAPGFLPGVGIATSGGFLADCIFLLLKRDKKLAVILMGGGVSILEAFELIWLGKMFSIPGIETFSRLFLSPIIIPATFAAGAFAGYMGYLIYKKLENTSIVKRIQA